LSTRALVAIVKI